MTLSVLAPVPGRAVALDTVPDPVFAGGMVGPGCAVDPDRGPLTAVAPVSGTVVKAHPHAFVVVADGGRGVLVHLGIDTVELGGAGFELLVAEGEQVAAGQPVVRWDAAAVETGGRSPLCPVVALDAPADAVEPRADARVDAGAELFAWR
jgi:PTS system N-acetylglucosamine-specific IIA component